MTSLQLQPLYTTLADSWVSTGKKTTVIVRAGEAFENIKSTQTLPVTTLYKLLTWNKTTYLLQLLCIHPLQVTLGNSSRQSEDSHAGEEDRLPSDLSQLQSLEPRGH